jgi:outer membrane protein, multidrug efflux system
MKKILSIIILLAALNACMVGPKYTRPEIKSPESWIEQSKFVDPNDSIANLEWFELFQDSVLNGLIDTALKYNYNLANAVIRIEQSREAYGISKANQWPALGYQANGQVHSANSLSPNNFNFGATASWEIDFWGKLRHAKKAAYYDLLASEEGVKAVTTILISDVASLYFQIRDLDNRLLIANNTVKSRTMYFNLVNERFKGGNVAELDMLQADQQLQLAKATVSSLTRQLNASERSMNILLGQMPQNMPRGLENVDQQNIPLIPAGLPSTLLEQRPDVKQAEYQLESQTHRIGVAQAARFPSLSLTGLLGFASTDLSSLVTDASFAGSASAAILGPIFNFGANKKRVNLQREETKIAANNYVNVYISALGEVESSLVAVQTLGDEYEARKRQAEAASKALMLSQERYNQGYSDYLEVLIAETAMFDSELAASATKSQQLSSYVQLYRSLGGGW